MTLLPESCLKKWRNRALGANENLLQNLLEFGEFYDELKGRHGELMKAYDEAATANMMSMETFRDRFGLVKRYQAKDLLYWFANGISFDHLDKSPSLAEISKRTPKQLLDLCIDPGNETGQTMNVREMTAFALQGTDKQRVQSIWHFEDAFKKVWKLPKLLGWAEDKAQNFERELKQLINRYVEV